MNKNLLGSLWDMIRHYRWRFLLAFLLVLISNALLVLNPLIFRQAILAVTIPEEISTPQANFFYAILGPLFHCAYSWAYLLIGIATLSAILKYYMRMIFISIGREVEVEVRNQLFERIQAQSRTFFDLHGIGDLISRLTNDITAYRDLLGPGMMYPLFFITLVTPALIALFFLSPLMATVSLIPIIGIYLFHIAIRQPLLQASQEVQKSLGEMSMMVHEHYSGIRILKSYGIERLTAGLFEKICLHFNKLNMRFVCLQGMVFPVLTLIIKMINVLVVLLAGAIILLGWSQLDVADFLSFMWIQSYIFSPLLMLGWIMPMYQKGKAAYARLVEIYEEPIEVQNEKKLLINIPEQASIHFKNLTFHYPFQKRSALVELNLSIKGGSFVGITGPVGAGKTTLFRLLNREYEIPNGKIFIADRDIHDYPLQAFQQAIVTVEQLPFLFSKNIRDNIGLGQTEAKREEIEQAAKHAALHESILGFPLQYETLVGERGVSLSGGQKQRMAIARAFLVNRSLLLLDDIFSALDVETEKHIFDSMRANFVGKTVLLITHRISILERLDHVIYLKNGQIIEEGSPEQLMALKGSYEALVNLQKIKFS
jgi:ATP-binding cassette, subfamily B, multidrug efflux pump